MKGVANMVDVTRWRRIERRRGMQCWIRVDPYSGAVIETDDTRVPAVVAQDWLDNGEARYTATA